MARHGLQSHELHANLVWHVTAAAVSTGLGEVQAQDSGHSSGTKLHTRAGLACQRSQRREKKESCSAQPWHIGSMIWEGFLLLFSLLIMMG
jgi:hypothetical protein